MIPRCFPTTVDSVTAGIPPEMNVYFLASINGLTAWVDYIPVKTATSSFTPQGTTNTGGYQAVNIFTSTTGKSAWVDYIPVYETAGTNPWVDHIPVAAGVNSAGQGVTDPFFASVATLLHMDDLGLTDVTGKTITKVGNTTRSATESKFGGYSAAFDGTGDYLLVGSNSQFSFLSNLTTSYTVECWVRVTSFANYRCIAQLYDNGPTQPHFTLIVNQTNGVVSVSVGRTDSSSAIFVNSLSGLTAGQWHHVAVTYSTADTKLRLFIDGVSQGEAIKVGTFGAQTVQLRVGAYYSGGAFSMLGYIDDFRVTQGVARYTSNFSVPTAAFQDA